MKSIFEIINPIMVGPSSSHTAGAVRLGLLVRDIYSITPQKVTFKLYNSYAQTGFGHGTDKGLLAGVLGIGVSDVRIKNVFSLPEAQEIEHKFEILENFNFHPNTVEFVFEGKQKMIIRGESIGAGNVKITNINNFATSITGEYDTLILFYRDKPGVVSRISGIIQNEDINIAALICERNIRGEDASMSISLDSALNYSAIQKISQFEDIYVVRQVTKLEN